MYTVVVDGYQSPNQVSHEEIMEFLEFGCNVTDEGRIAAIFAGVPFEIDQRVIQISSVES